jgi:hypothetical protein
MAILPAPTPRVGSCSAVSRAAAAAMLANASAALWVTAAPAHPDRRDVLPMCCQARGVHRTARRCHMYVLHSVARVAACLNASNSHSQAIQTNTLQTTLLHPVTVSHAYRQPHAFCDTRCCPRTRPLKLSPITPRPKLPCNRGTRPARAPVHAAARTPSSRPHRSLRVTAELFGWRVAVVIKFAELYQQRRLQLATLQ